MSTRRRLQTSYLSLSSSFTTSHPYIFYQTMDLVLSLYTVVYVVHLVVTLANQGSARMSDLAKTIVIFNCSVIQKVYSKIVEQWLIYLAYYFQVVHDLGLRSISASSSTVIQAPCYINNKQFPCRMTSVTSFIPLARGKSLRRRLKQWVTITIV